MNLTFFVADIGLMMLVSFHVMFIEQQLKTKHHL